jgi:hypothetical protein
VQMYVSFVTESTVKLPGPCVGHPQAFTHRKHFSLSFFRLWKVDEVHSDYMWPVCVPRIIPACPIDAMFVDHDEVSYLFRLSAAQSFARSGSW